MERPKNTISPYSKKKYETRSSAHQVEQIASWRLTKVMAEKPVTDYEWGLLRESNPLGVRFWEGEGLSRQEIFNKLNK